MDKKSPNIIMTWQHGFRECLPLKSFMNVMFGAMGTSSNFGSVEFKIY